MNAMDQKITRIRDLNDALRRRILMPAMVGCKDRIDMTRGIAALGAEAMIKIAIAVAAFDDFTPDNDPFGEHDFGAIDFAGQGIFWKISYYDMDLQYHSDDPADDSITRRVLMIMLADEC